jgi:hypothetical protein
MLTLFLLGKFEGNRPLGRPVGMLKDNIDFYPR